MMAMSDSFLSIAGWLFFTVWSMIVGAVSLAAFGRDLLPSRAALTPPALPADQLSRTQDSSRLR